jgi:hypothetical protein
MVMRLRESPLTWHRRAQMTETPRIVRAAPAPQASEIYADDGVTPLAVERLRAAAAHNAAYYAPDGPQPNRVLCWHAAETARIAATRHGAVGLLLGRLGPESAPHLKGQ